MGFPYNFPFSFAVKRLLRLFGKSDVDLKMTSQITCPLRLFGEKKHGLYMKSTISKDLCLLSKIRTSLYLTSTKNGGG